MATFFLMVGKPQCPILLKDLTFSEKQLHIKHIKVQRGGRQFARQAYTTILGHKPYLPPTVSASMVI